VLAVSEPQVSVVVPTMGTRPGRLAALLGALAAQDVALEVIVGRDPGVTVPPGPGELSVRTAESAAPASAAAKRNLAWPLARAPLVAFTDDDCRPAPGWAAALLAAHERAPRAFVQGRTEPDAEELGDLWGLARTQEIDRDSPWHETCNIAYPRELLERLGGFDEGYGLLGGEDTDLGARALQGGTPKVYVREALVWHAVERRSFRQALREAARTRDQPQVLARFPELRRELVLHLFTRRSHALLALALAGALTRKPLPAALAAAPYVRFHLDHHRISPASLVRAATHLPVRALADSVEIAVVARRGLRRGVIAF